MKECRDVEPLKAPYVEDEGPPAERSIVDAHLKKCGRCRDEVAVERAARDVLVARRDELRSTAPELLKRRCAAHAATVIGAAAPPRVPLYRRWVPMSLAATLLLAVVGVFGLGLTNKSQALAFQMTLDHWSCSRTVHASEAGALATSAGWEDRMGWKVRLPPSSEDPPLRLKGLRRCFVTDGAVAHALYDWRGESLSVYEMPTESLRAAADVRRFGHEAVMWSQNGRTYVVLARTRRPDLDGVVRYVKANVY
jgi:anti-sigma factor RsiW